MPTRKTMGLKQYAVALAAVFCASFASFGAASASTVFDITGNSSFSGNLTIDTVGGSLTAADVLVGSPPDFQSILTTTQGSTEFTVGITNTTISPGPILYLSFADGGTLVGFTGGTIDTATLDGGCDLTSPFLCRGIPNELGSATLSSGTTATPLPDALSLFATGLGAMIMLVWLRSRMVGGGHLTETGTTIQTDFFHQILPPTALILGLVLTIVWISFLAYQIGRLFEAT